MNFPYHQTNQSEKRKKNQNLIQKGKQLQNLQKLQIDNYGPHSPGKDRSELQNKQPGGTSWMQKATRSPSAWFPHDARLKLPLYPSPSKNRNSPKPLLSLKSHQQQSFKLYTHLINPKPFINSKCMPKKGDPRISNNEKPDLWRNPTCQKATNIEI